MSDISQIRSLIGDQILYDRAVVLGDGVSTEFQVPNFPTYPDSQTVILDNSPQTEGSDYTLDDLVGLITFASAPGDGVSVIITYKHVLLTDDQLQDFLDLEGGDIKLAAADALDSIATTQALIQKVMKVLDLQTDGAKLAEALRKHAASLRKQVADALVVADDAADFDYAEQIYDTNGLYEKIIKDIMRAG